MPSVVDLGPGRTARVLVTGFLHTCALLDDASAKCWGQINYDISRTPSAPYDFGPGRDTPSRRLGA